MIERLDENTVVMTPGPFDVHLHPRVFDPILQYGENQDGKAGLGAYTETMLRSGFTGGLVMPNETMRLPLGLETGETMTAPYPMSTREKLLAMNAAIARESYVPLGSYFGLDPKMVYKGDAREEIDFDAIEAEFASVSDDVMALKIYGGETEGGYNVLPGDIPSLAEGWHVHNPEKPITMHLEDEDVGRVLAEVEKTSYGKDIPIHIAHVSSRQELEAVIEAKERGMNVTCEVTPHHLFLDESARQQIGGYGCMKPTLKSKEDIAFIWANIDKVDIFASDCAPHRYIDKESESPTFGVTNHTSMMQLLLGAVDDGKLSFEELYKKVCVNPRRRFNVPLGDKSQAVFDVSPGAIESADQYEKHINPKYGFNPFPRMEWHGQAFKLRGHLLGVRAGYSDVEFGNDAGDIMRTNALHLITPQIIENVRKSRIG